MSEPLWRFPRRARRLWAYWRAEQRTLRQGLVALALSTLAGFVAGLTLAHITGTLEELPGLIVLIPAAVGMKGTIFGAIGARLGTANVAGLLEPTLRRGGVLYRNVYVAVVTTFSSALWLAVLSRLVSAAFGAAVDPALAARDDLDRRRRDRLGARSSLITLGALGPLLPARLGPRLGVHADGHRPRRHDHAARACSSRRSSCASRRSPSRPR